MPNYLQFLSRVSSARKSSVIRDLLKRLQNAGPEMIPLSGGLPNPAMFPFKSASVVLSNDQEIKLEGEKLSSALQARHFNTYSCSYDLSKSNCFFLTFAKLIAFHVSFSTSPQTVTRP